MTDQTIHTLIENAEVFRQDPPRALRREAFPATPYPIAALGSVLGQAAQAIHEKIQAPQAIGAQSVLAAATLTVQGHADVELPIGQRRPLSAFFMTIATTGERKSSCDMEALKPLNRKEEALRAQYTVDVSQWRNEKEAWELARAEILKNKTKQPQQEIAASLGALGECPEPPLLPLLTCPEPTFEGICKHLVTGQPSLGVFSDEGGQFIGGYGMNEDNRLKTAGAFCSLWDGKPLKRVRAGDGTLILPGRRISVHLMVQPSVAAILLSNKLLEDQGLLSRFLFTVPESTIGTRFYKECDPSHRAALHFYEDVLLAILDIPLPLKKGRQNELDPRVLSFNGDATRLWSAFVNDVERNMAVGNVWEQMRGFANKLPEQAARLAGVLTLIADINATQITQEAIHAGVALASYYANEALRLCDQGYIDPDILLAERLLQWLHASWMQETISLPDVYQRGPKTLSDKKTAQKIVSILEEHGWLVRVKDGDFVNGARRKEVWGVVRGIF